MFKNCFMCFPLRPTNRARTCGFSTSILRTTAYLLVGAASSLRRVVFAFRSPKLVGAASSLRRVLFAFCSPKHTRGRVAATAPFELDRCDIVRRHSRRERRTRAKGESSRAISAAARAISIPNAPSLARDDDARRARASSRTAASVPGLEGGSGAARHTTVPPNEKPV